MPTWTNSPVSLETQAANEQQRLAAIKRLPQLTDDDLLKNQLRKRKRKKPTILAADAMQAASAVQTLLGV